MHVQYHKMASQREDSPNVNTPMAQIGANVRGHLSNLFSNEADNNQPTTQARDGANPTAGARGTMLNTGRTQVITSATQVAATSSPGHDSNAGVGLVSKLPKVIMGKWEETYEGSGVFHLLRPGGVPKADWSGLLPEDKQEFRAITGRHYRSLNPVKGVKGLEAREEGLEEKFHKGEDLTTCQQALKKHFEQHGMDTVTYLQDPHDLSKMQCVLEHHPKYVPHLDKSLKMAERLATKFDKYNMEDDSTCKEFLLNSLSNDLKQRMLDKWKASDTFTMAWFKFVHYLNTTSLDRFDTLKSEIKVMAPPVV